MNKKNIISIAVITIIISVAIVYFNSSQNNFNEEEKFYGSWISEDGLWNYTFYKNNSCKINNEWNTWYVEKGKLVVELDDGHRINSNDYSFSENYKKLKISGIIFEKV